MIASDMRDLFITFSIEKLRQMRERIDYCLDRLTADQIWWRQADTQNAVGNLVLHLSGNLNQWIVSGLGGKADTRNRDAEFAARGAVDSGELKRTLEESVNAAAAVLEQITPERLQQRVLIQGYERSVLEAIYHVVEHFSHHTGQVLYATKLMTAQDLGFYKHLNRVVHSEKIP
jgi:uncharacterized damage-inducible protein DinB